jgi:hypothetical protein
MKVKKFKKGEKLVEFITLAELAKLCGKETITLQKMGEKKVGYPSSNFRAPSITLKGGTERDGARLYSVKYAKLMAEQIKLIRQGIKKDPEVSSASFGY